MAIIPGGGSEANRKAISRKVQAGELIKLHANIYTDEINTDLTELVRLHTWEISSLLAPGAVVSHRSAYDPRVTPDDYFFITYKRDKKINLHGVTFVLVKGPQPLEGDRQLGELDLYQSQYERMILENLQISRGVKKSLGKNKIEEILHDLVISAGEDRVNAHRDRARIISKELDMNKEFMILDGIIGALLTSHPARNLKTDIGKSMARGVPYDTNRLRMFESLAFDLDKEQLPKFSMKIDENTWHIFSFFESYFSNYIEGTIFTVEEAKKIVSSGKALPEREQDSHDILGTFSLTSDKGQMRTLPENPDSLKNLLRERHSILMHERPSKHPGVFKQMNNQAGAYIFVDHQLVSGTIEKAWKFYDYLQNPVAKAYFMMFLVAEVHPFEDGNGRIARIMMNSSLHASGLFKIMIPTVYRTDYLAALRAMSNNMNSIPLVHMLNRIFEFSSTVNQDSFEDMLDYLNSCNAFSDQEADVLRFSN